MKFPNASAPKYARSSQGPSSCQLTSHLMRGSVQHALGLQPAGAHARPRPKFTIPDESLFEEDAARLCMMRECESPSSVCPSRLSRSALFPRPRLLPPSDGQLARGSNVSAASDPPGHMSDRKSLQEKTLFMVYASVITPPTIVIGLAVVSKVSTQNLGFRSRRPSPLTSALKLTYACLCNSFAGLSRCMRNRTAAFVKVCKTQKLFQTDLEELLSKKA